MLHILSTISKDKSGYIGKHKTCEAIFSATGKFEGFEDGNPL